MNCQQAKQIRIDDYLACLGYQPAKISAQRLTYHSMLGTGGDRTPSFQVSADGHAFFDWSSGACGSIVDLAMCIIGRRNVPAALAHIATAVGEGVHPTALDLPGQSFSFYKQKKTIDVKSILPITAPALLAYSRSRGITSDIVSRYCSEVHYCINGSAKEYYSLGFRNDSGGWELRNLYSKVASSPKDITTVNDLCGCTMLVLEGFFDFLAACQMKWFRANQMNAVVLNSTSLLDHALPVVREASRVICLLDNDDAGRRATERILSSCAVAEDHSYLYGQQNDLNDHLIAINKKFNK